MGRSVIEQEAYCLTFPRTGFCLELCAQLKRSLISILSNLWRPKQLCRNERPAPCQNVSLIGKTDLIGQSSASAVPLLALLIHASDE